MNSLRNTQQQDSALAKLTQVLALILAFGILYFFANSCNASEGIQDIAILDLLLLIPVIPIAVGNLTRTQGVAQVYSYGSFVRLAIACFAAYSLFTVLVFIPQIMAGNSLSFFADVDGYATELYTWEEYFFLADAQPYVEEILRFFFVPTTAALLFRAFPLLGLRVHKYVCIFISIFLIWSPLFAIYHLGVVENGLIYAPGTLEEKSEMLFVNLFSIYFYACLFSIMNYALGTCAFSIIYHKLHNTFGYYITHGLPELPLWFTCFEAAFFAVTIGLIFVGLGIVIKRKGFR